MRTFTTNVAAGVSGDSEPIYLIKISPSSVAPADSWSTFRWGTRAIDFGSGENYLGGVILRDGIEDINMGVSLEKGGNIAQVADFQLKIANAQYSGDTRFDGYVKTNNIYFENRIIELRIIFADKTPLDWANTFVVWTGIIDQAYAESYGEFLFECVDSTWAWDREIPQVPIKKEDYSGANDVPSKVVGKPYPIVFGDVDKAKGYLVKQTNTGQVVAFGEDGKTNKAIGDVFVYLSGRFIRLYEEAEAGHYEYTKDATYKRKITFNANSVLQSSVGKLLLSFLSEPISYDPYYNVAYSVDGEKAIDKDMSSYAYTQKTGGTASAPAYLPYRLEDFDGLSGEVKGLYLICKCELASVMGSGGWVRADINPNEDTTTPDAVPDIYIFGATGTQFNNIDGSDGEKDLPRPITSAYDDISKLRLAYIHFTQYKLAATYPQFRVYEFSLRIDFKVDLRKQDYYAGIEGRVF